MEPLSSLTAAAIANLAFQKAIESGAGELAKKFTEVAIKRIDDLRNIIWERLRGKHEKAEEALQKAVTGDKQAIDVVAKLLDVELLDPDFAKQVQTIAQEIKAGKLVDNSSMTQINQDNARGWQTKVEGGTAYIGEIHQHNIASKPDSK
jgi:hypothetical protein